MEPEGIRKIFKEQGAEGAIYHLASLLEHASEDAITAASQDAYAVNARMDELEAKVNTLSRPTQPPAVAPRKQEGV